MVGRGVEGNGMIPDDVWMAWMLGGFVILALVVALA